MADGYESEGIARKLVDDNVPIPFPAPGFGGGGGCGRRVPLLSSCGGHIVVGFVSRRLVVVLGKLVG